MAKNSKRMGKLEMVGWSQWIGERHSHGFSPYLPVTPRGDGNLRDPVGEKDVEFMWLGSITVGRPCELFAVG